MNQSSSIKYRKTSQCKVQKIIETTQIRQDLGCFFRHGCRIELEQILRHLDANKHSKLLIFDSETLENFRDIIDQLSASHHLIVLLEVIRCFIHDI